MDIKADFAVDPLDPDKSERPRSESDGRNMDIMSMLLSTNISIFHMFFHIEVILWVLFTRTLLADSIVYNWFEFGCKLAGCIRFTSRESISRFIL